MNHGLLQKVLFKITKDRKSMKSKSSTLGLGVCGAVEKSFLGFANDKLQEAKNACSDTSVIEGRYQYFLK